MTEGVLEKMWSTMKRLMGLSPSRRELSLCQAASAELLRTRLPHIDDTDVVHPQTICHLLFRLQAPSSETRQNQCSTIRSWRFLQISKNATFNVFFDMTCQKLVEVVNKSVVVSSSNWVHTFRAVITVIMWFSSQLPECNRLIFPNNWLLKLEIWPGYDASVITQQDVWCWWLTVTDFR